MKSQTVILIDDSQEDAALMERALKRVAPAVKFKWIGDATEGLRLLLDWEPDDSAVIFMDIKMPKLSGLEILEQLSEHDKFAAIHRINMLSSSVLKQDIDSALQYPNVTYNTKPEGYVALRQLLQTIITPSQPNSPVNP